MSDERFGVGGTLIEAAATMKNFGRRDDDDDSRDDGECATWERTRSRFEAGALASLMVTSPVHLPYPPTLAVT